MILKILSKDENVKPLLLNSTTCNLLCVSEQRESRLRERERERERQREREREREKNERNPWRIAI